MLGRFSPSTSGYQATCKTQEEATVSFRFTTLTQEVLPANPDSARFRQSPNPRLHCLATMLLHPPSSFLEAMNSYGFDRVRSCRLAKLAPRGTEQCPALSVVSLSAGFLTLSCHLDKYRRPPLYGSRPRHENRRTGEHETLPRTFQAVALSCILNSAAQQAT
jgi:hypothetical protein